MTIHFTKQFTSINRWHWVKNFLFDGSTQSFSTNCWIPTDEFSHLSRLTVDVDGWTIHTDNWCQFFLTLYHCARDQFGCHLSRQPTRVPSEYYTCLALTCMKYYDLTIFFVYCCTLVHMSNFGSSNVTRVFDINIYDILSSNIFCSLAVLCKSNEFRIPHSGQYKVEGPHFSKKQFEVCKNDHGAFWQTIARRFLQLMPQVLGWSFRNTILCPTNPTTSVQICMHW